MQDLLWIDRDQPLRELHELLIERRERIVAVSGPPGGGKTALVRRFLSLYPDAFPGGVSWFDPPWPLDDYPGDLAMGAIGQRGARPHEPSLFVVEGMEEWLTIYGIEATGPGASDRIAAGLERPLGELSTAIRETAQQVALLSRVFLPGLPSVVLPEFDLDAASRLLLAFAGRQLEPGSSDYLSLHQALHEIPGNPLLLSLLGREVGREQLSLDKLPDLMEFQTGGLIRDDGLVVPLEDKRAAEASLAVAGVTDELIRYLAGNPSATREMDPRKFEELVAELFARGGWEVTLTPQTRDGGVDIYAVRKSGLGSLLYLVECKRLNPPSKVGLHVVQRLHGVVSSKKATAGVVVTTTDYSLDAVKWVNKETLQHRISLEAYFDFLRWLRSGRVDPL
jgi:hypothetical protein